MPFWRLYYHLIWATKHRAPLLTPAAENLLYPYLVSKAAEDGVFIYIVNSWHDHIHMVAAIPPKHAVANIVKRLKGSSSHFLGHELGLAFEWNRGYGALSVGERQRPIAEAYVRNQKQHHAQQSTNTWLERDDEHDEGPLDTYLRSDSPGTTIQESPILYGANDGLLF